MIEGAEFDEHIRANGQRDEITIFGGKILDRNRYRGYQQAGIKPRLAYFRRELHGDPIAFVQPAAPPSQRKPAAVDRL
jgi:hypothetical protein